jgi:hypothetical protein
MKELKNFTLNHWPASPMHQEFEVNYYWFPEAVKFMFWSGKWHTLPESVRAPLVFMILSVLQPALEYADDGSDPIELLEMGNSELDFIDHLLEDMDAKEMGNG